MWKILNIVQSFFQINVSYEDFENLTKDNVKRLLKNDGTTTFSTPVAIK
jgi:predicted phosphoribosyltransferase